MNANDLRDAETNNLRKRYMFKFFKGKNYKIELIGIDFRCGVRLLSKNGIGEIISLYNWNSSNVDQERSSQSLIPFSPEETAEHPIVVASREFGNFILKVSEYSLRLEAKPHVVGIGIEINGQIDESDETALGKFGKIYSVELKADNTYTIDVASQGPHGINVLDDKGKMLPGAGLNSIDCFHAERDGVYHILVSSFGASEFTFSVARISIQGEKKPRIVGNGVTINGQIGEDDNSGLEKSRLGKTYTFEFKAGNTYTISLDSQEFLYLNLFDDMGSKRLAVAGKQIVFQPKHDGIYHVLVPAERNSRTGGEFTLSVRKKD